jgi:hypothetical protein
MAQWHLDELRVALERMGWRIGELPGDDYRLSATWALKRAAQLNETFIDFEGLDDMRTLPVVESYACLERGTQNSLYFGRHGEGGSPTREGWKANLAAFVRAIGGVPAKGR